MRAPEALLQSNQGKTKRQGASVKRDRRDNIVQQPTSPPSWIFENSAWRMAGTHLLHNSTNGTLHQATLTEPMMEPNGITKGALPPVPAPTPALAPVSAPVPVSAPPPTTVPVLPDNMNAMVPLGAVIHRMTNDAFAELSNLSET